MQTQIGRRRTRSLIGSTLFALNTGISIKHDNHKHQVGITSVAVQELKKKSPVVINELTWKFWEFMTLTYRSGTGWWWFYLKRWTVPINRPRPSCSKLTTSLVNDSLKFTMSDTQICWFFLLKKCELLLQCKSYSHFFSKKYQNIVYWIR